MLVSLLLGIYGCTAGDGSCTRSGKRYENGKEVPSGDCNTCSCSDGEVSCTKRACTDGCSTPAECADCADARAAIDAAIRESRICDPGSEGQCTRLVSTGQDCSCDLHVNAEATDAIARVDAAVSDYMKLSCSSHPDCGACPNFVVSTCSGEGLCEDVPDNGGSFCKVNGVLYAHGSTGIDDPRSCNECSCDGGELVCDAVDCPEDPCLSGSAFGKQCIQCGPTDECQVFEYKCLPTCTDGCESGQCVDGLCRSVCG